MKFFLLLFIVSFFVACNSKATDVIDDGEKVPRSKNVNIRKKVNKESEIDHSMSNSAEKRSLRFKPLTVEVKALLSKTATVDIRVYNTAEGFLKEGGAIGTYRFKPENGLAILKIEDLPYGIYAMAIYQDLDESGEIGKNMVGIPNEPFAVSNDIKPGLGAPPFEACSFNYSSDENEVVVHLMDGIL